MSIDFLVQSINFK